MGCFGRAGFNLYLTILKVSDDLVGLQFLGGSNEARTDNIGRRGIVCGDCR